MGQWNGKMALSKSSGLERPVLLMLLFRLEGYVWLVSVGELLTYFAEPTLSVVSGW